MYILYRPQSGEICFFEINPTPMFCSDRATTQAANYFVLFLVVNHHTVDNSDSTNIVLTPCCTARTRNISHTASVRSVIQCSLLRIYYMHFTHQQEMQVSHTVSHSAESPHGRMATHFVQILDLASHTHLLDMFYSSPHRTCSDFTPPKSGYCSSQHNNLTTFNITSRQLDWMGALPIER